MSSLFQQAPFLVGGSVYQFGQSATLQYGVFGEGTYNYTLGVPPGSTCLERGTITISTDMSSSTLTFEAREEDSGFFTCMIDGGTGPTIFVAIGNASLFHPVHYKDQGSISLIQFQLLLWDQWT